MVDRLDRRDQDEAATFRANQLGGHLINRLWHGQIELDSPDGLLRRYYAHASTEIANDLLRAIGVGLHELETADAGLVDRLTALWEFRIAAVRNGADPSELTEFGRWFASGRFDPVCSLRQLLNTLSLADD